MRIFLSSDWASRSTFPISELCFQLVLQFGKLLLFALDLVPILSLFVFNLCDLFNQLSEDTRHLGLVLTLGGLHLAL